MKLRKRRKFVNRKKRIMFFSLFFMLLFISVGYAYLSAALSINGRTELSANTWNIHFENLSVTDGSVTAVTPAEIQSDTTAIDYSVVLDSPGDFYEFEVDVVNSGTLGGKLVLSSIQGISSEAEPYLESSVKYTNGTPVQVNDLINPGTRKRIFVKIAYKDNLQSLPEDDIVLNLVYNLNYIQTSEEEPFSTNNIIVELIEDSTSCFIKYNGDVTDRVGVTEAANNVYFNKCADKRNVIFGEYCWQIIRTTETGGLKMVYNGEPVDGKCESTRGDHKGIVFSNHDNQTLNGSYLYGDSFTYDTTNNIFTLVDTTTATWSDSTYENLLGKFTCKNTTGTCTTIYNVNGYYSNKVAYASAYTIGDSSYAEIGNSSINSSLNSLAAAGYMFNNVYYTNFKRPETTEYKYGNTFTYNNGAYTLSGTTQNINDWSTGYNTIENTHYTCWNTSGTCSTISYIFHTSSSIAYYIDIDGGKSINDALEEMLSDDNVNRYNSTIKGIIDAWYAQNLSSKTNMLEDTVYCNPRNIIEYGGWNPSGGSTSIPLQFKNYSSTTNLDCPNETDQFSLINNKAKLTYPVGLITIEELKYIGTSSLRKTGDIYWTISPYRFFMFLPQAYYIESDGKVTNSWVEGSGTFMPLGVRPTISLASGTVISSGTGSETDPWIVE